MVYRFGPYRADRTSFQVVEGDRALALTPKLLDLLFYLLDRPATLVTKEQLLADVWPGANVTDNALAQAVSELRDALGDAAGKPTYIRTIARRGYRFIAPVEHADAPAADTSSPGPPGRSTPDATRAIAVLDFTNVTADPEVAWLSAGIAETVTSDLARLDHFRVIDRWRVLQATRRAAASGEDAGAALPVDLLVTGSFQRSGPHLRITARVVERASSDAVADIKVDGRLDDVFRLQDGIVSAFARALGVPAPAGSGPPIARETSSLAAYQAYIEGWLKIESLHTDLVPASIRDFQEAIQLDPGYALAHTGLANAHFVAYEMTRATLRPDVNALSAGIEHARRAIRLDAQFAEAHATLSFLLVEAARFDEARTAAQQAAGLEPDSWRHQYRLGHASWGSARLGALERTVAIYPQFAYARFEATMVHVARGAIELAEDAARAGATEQDRQAQAANRFPAIGFHWLLGMLALARRRHDEAITEFDRELAQADPRRLYGPEYGALALAGRGQVELARDRPRQALTAFRAALEHVADHPRARLGELVACRRTGDRSGAERAAAAADQARRVFDDTGRHGDALYVSACLAAAHGDLDPAIGHLERLLSIEPPTFVGWPLPVDPFLRPLADHPRFPAVLARLADRAR
jgi:DNA-binding winged helix-turn-helix (wHTH) protein/tetratricopeptide (TPR) repeat protein